MPHPRDRLRPGEQIILDTRPHWWYFARPTALLLGSIFMGVLVLILNSRRDEETDSEPIIEVGRGALENIQVGPDLGFLNSGSVSSIMQIATGIAILIAITILGITIASWYFTHFFVSTDRVVNRSGILNRQGVEIPIERVNTVFFEQNLVERIVGAGDVLVESAGESGVQRFYDIANPLAVQERLQQQIESAVSRRAREANPNLGQSTETNNSFTEQLKELNELRRQGIITDSEFTAKKSEMLRRI